MTVERIETGDI